MKKQFRYGIVLSWSLFALLVVGAFLSRPLSGHDWILLVMLLVIVCGLTVGRRSVVLLCRRLALGCLVVYGIVTLVGVYGFVAHSTELAVLTLEGLGGMFIMAVYAIAAKNILAGRSVEH